MIRVITADTGELIRELTLGPTRDYQPTGRAPGPPRKTPVQVVGGLSAVRLDAYQRFRLPQM